MIPNLRTFLAPIALCLCFASGNASATWIRYLLVEHADPGRPMQLQEQVSQGGDWFTGDPNTELFFGRYAENVTVSDITSRTFTLAFDLFLNPDDHTQGVATADTGRFNFFKKGSSDLTALLEITQDESRVTLTYRSLLGGPALPALPGGVWVDGIGSIDEENARWGFDLCAESCADARRGGPDGEESIFPLGLFFSVARIPEPPAAPLLALALLVLVCSRRWSQRRLVED